MVSKGQSEHGLKRARVARVKAIKNRMPSLIAYDILAEAHLHVYRE
jgi:hypothetical protein